MCSGHEGPRAHPSPWGHPRGLLATTSGPSSCLAGGTSADKDNTRNNPGTLKPAGLFPCLCPPGSLLSPQSRCPTTHGPCPPQRPFPGCDIPHGSSPTLHLPLPLQGRLCFVFPEHPQVFPLHDQAGTSTGLVPQHLCHCPCATHGALRVTSATQMGSQSHHSGTKTWPKQYKIEEKAKKCGSKRETSWDSTGCNFEAGIN